MTEEHTFKPKTNKLNTKMEEKVNRMRNNYNLTKEHSKTPTKKINRERALKDAADAKKKMEEFLERNNALRLEVERKKTKLKEEIEAEEREKNKSIHFQSNKQSEVIIKESERFRDKDLIKRQEDFLNNKMDKLQEKIKERDEKERIDNFRFQKATDKKKPTTRGNKGVDQSAKTAELGGNPNNSDNSYVLNENERSRSSLTNNKDKNRRKMSLDEKPVGDYSRVTLPGEGEGNDHIIVLFKAEDYEENHKSH